VSEIRAVKFNYVLEEDKSGLYSLEFEGDREMTTEEQLAALKVIRTRMDIIKSDVVPSSMWCNPRRYRLANVPEIAIADGLRGLWRAGGRSPGTRRIPSEG
jgi:hypothetical protein